VAHSQFAHRANYVPPALKERDHSQDDMYRDWILAYTSNEIDEMSATPEGIQVVLCLSTAVLQQIKCISKRSNKWLTCTIVGTEYCLFLSSSNSNGVLECTNSKNRSRHGGSKCISRYGCLGLRVKGTGLGRQETGDRYGLFPGTV
jgi:hypothetical protein